MGLFDSIFGGGNEMMKKVNAANKGYQLNQQGHADEAIRVFQEMVSADPKDILGHGGLGMIYRQKGRLEDAANEYRAILETARTTRDISNEISARISLGNIYNEQGKLDDAIREYQSVLQIDKNYPAAHAGLGMVYQKQGRLDNASSEFKKAGDTANMMMQSMVLRQKK